MAEEAAERPSLVAAARLSWWKLLLVYPAILTSLGGAIPTAWQAFTAWRLDVAYSRVQIAEEQRRLWEKNLSCLDLRPVYSVSGPSGVVIGVTLCPSGDALLRYEVGEEVTYTWIAYPHAPGSASRAGPGSGAGAGPVSPHGAGLAPQAPRVSGVAWAQEPPSPLDRGPGQAWRSQLLYGASRCVRLHAGLVLRLHTTDGQTCLLEHIHLGSGRVVTQVVVPCSTPCPVLHSFAPSSPARALTPSGR